MPQGYYGAGEKNTAVETYFSDYVPHMESYDVVVRKNFKAKSIKISSQICANCKSWQ